MPKTKEIEDTRPEWEIKAEDAFKDDPRAAE